MRLLLCAPLLLLLGCPKKDIKTLEEIDRERELKELLEEDEIWEDLPEAGEEDESSSS
jgi:hypothetical protein|tara:strand:+ start:2497 stop:2670 length:174 start_codon:yes stop_codon:yes gene_type:complete